ncbi:MAG: DUF2752 domain-containing protein [Muribaculaceae bacterium]|nr:DUF2752 domain-containing protein [Muribaculaceae bacterium]
MPNRSKAILRIGFVTLIVTSLIILWKYDPTKIAWAPQCPVHLLTGFQCPGCGISRATHALLHGRLYEALSYNWFFIISIPYFLSVCAVCYIPSLKCHTQLSRFITGPIPAWTYVTLFCIWFVVRNILGI